MLTLVCVKWDSSFFSPFSSEPSGFFFALNNEDAFFKGGRIKILNDHSPNVFIIKV